MSPLQQLHLGVAKCECFTKSLTSQVELNLELPAEESKYSASFFSCSLINYLFFAASTADIFMVVGLGRLWKCIVYRVLFSKEIAQKSRNHWLRNLAEVLF